MSESPSIVYKVDDLEPWLLPYIPDQGVLALDIGANDGAWTRLLADRFDYVHAFEPQPLFQLRNLSPFNVRIIEMAVGKRVDDLELYTFEKSVHASYDASPDANSDRGHITGMEKVPMVSIDTLGYKGKPVDFIKIDVEGMETEVLDGSTFTILERKPRIVVEIHSKEAGEWVENRKALNAVYEMESIPHPHPDAGPFHRWIHMKPRAASV